MKIFVLGRVGWEYNDEDYYRPECDGVEPVKAFRSKENAEAERNRLNEEEFDPDMTGGDGRPIRDLYEVKEVEVADNDVDSYIAARQRVEAALKAARDAARVEFRRGAQELFDRFPGLESFSWAQYTPYFNDGEACHFSTHTEYPDINGVDSEYGGNDEYDHGTEWDRSQAKTVQVREPNDLARMQAAVSEFLSQFDDDDLQTLFGDHVTVTVPRDGEATTDSYDHD